VNHRGFTVIVMPEFDYLKDATDMVPRRSTFWST